MQTLMMDLRFGLRILRRNPGFAAVAIFILALGIGANTTIFSVVNALVFRPLPYPDPDRLVYVAEGNEQLKVFGAVSYPDFMDLKDQNQALVSLAVMAPVALNISGGGEPERISGLRVSMDLMPMLGAIPSLGRAFLSAEFAHDEAQVVILSHGLWQRRFGADPGIVGRVLIADGTPRSIIGVMPAGSRLAYLAGFEPEVMLPLTPGNTRDRGARSLSTIARLKPGVSIDRAQADLNMIGVRLAEQYPETNAGWGVRVSSLRSSVDPVAYALLATLVCSVLGIVCTNVANLLLARAAARGREMAVRAALGANRARLGRQLFVEGLLLAAAGTGLGVLAAFCVCGLIRSSAAGTNLELWDIRPDGRVLSATVLLFGVTAVAVALLPALRICRVDLIQSLRNGMGAAAGSPQKRFRSVLVAAEVMLSFVLLVGAGLVMKSWSRLWQTDLGYRVDNILTMSISLQEARYSDPRRQSEFFERLHAALASRGELQSTGLASSLPTWGGQVSFTMVGRPRPGPGEEWVAGHFAANPGYFNTMSILPKSGRVFRNEDSSVSLPVAVINQAMVRQYWKDRHPLGDQVEVKGKLRTIVGVIGDLRSVPFHMKPRPEIWVPLAQSPSRTVALVASPGTGDPFSAAPVIKRAIAAIDPDQPAAQIRTMEQVRLRDMGVIQAGTRLLGVLALGAVILASVGIYGVQSQSVSRRTAEFGIRMAMGARRSDVVALVLREGLALTLLGLIPGLLASLALGRVLASAIYGVRPLELWILLGLLLLLLAVSLLACYLPARRATLVDPAVSLRQQ